MVVLFDVDGTLVDHESASRSAASDLHELLGTRGSARRFVEQWTVAQERFMARYLRGELGFQEQRRERIRACVDPAASDVEADNLFAMYVDLYTDRWEPYPDVVDCLDGLEGFTLGVLTNGDPVQQRYKLERTGLAERFAYVLASGDCGHAKPHPGIFRRALADLGCPASSAVYVGDRYETDAVAARAVGMTGIWVARMSTRSDARPPVVSTLAQVPAIVRGCA